MSTSRLLIVLALVACATCLVLHGSQQTRSPLVNWFLIENKIPFTQAPPRPSNHPFGQTPFLTDEKNVEVFESGAILLYLNDKYVSKTPEERAKTTKWVVWANSELDGLCFGKNMGGTQLDKPGSRGLDVLESMLAKSNWLVDNTFSVADVAVGSYLNYVPVFFSSVYPVKRPNICRYMARCAARPAFASAFGEEHARLVLEKAPKWADGTAKNPKAGGFF